MPSDIAPKSKLAKIGEYTKIHIRFQVSLEAKTSNMTEILENVEQRGGNAAGVHGIKSYLKCQGRVKLVSLEGQRPVSKTRKGKMPSIYIQCDS